MRITGLNLQDFRNISFASLRFSKDRQFILGQNAQGKSNIVESLGLLTALRSFRTSNRSELIRFGASDARLHFYILHEKEGEVEVSVLFRRAHAEVVVNDQRVQKYRDFVGRFPTVVFSVQDIQLVRGSPNLRRRFIDLMLSSMDAGYLHALRRYYGALRERNSLLKSMKSADSAQLGGFERTLADSAVVLVDSRRRVIVRLCEDVAGIYGKMSDRQEVPTIRYHPNLDVGTEEEYRAILSELRESDCALHTTGRGPHRDDFEFVLKGKSARRFASEGQQRSLVIALRSAQAAWFREVSGVMPVILTDDVLGELDTASRRGFWNLLSRNCQVFATGTVAPPTDPDCPWNILEIKAGSLSC